MTNARAKALEAFKSVSKLYKDFEQPWLYPDDEKTIIEALTEPKWKSMENFPVDYREHLFFDGKNVCQGFLQWDKYYGYYYTSTTGSGIKPTHWVHLPDAPTGGES